MPAESVWASEPLRMAVWGSRSCAIGWFHIGATPEVIGVAIEMTQGPLDLALGIERGEIGILEDIAVDRQRHALLDLADETAAAPRSAA